MKSFLNKRWHSIPVALVSALLVLALVAGGALAAYGFLKSDVQVDVEEAIAVGTWDTWDNLHPYGSEVAAVWYDCEGDQADPINCDGDHDLAAGRGVLGDLFITISDPDLGDPHEITITHVGSGKYVGSGFAAGEWIVIPLNIRSGSSGELTLGASWDDGGSGLILEHTWEVNGVGEGFIATEIWEPLEDWNPTIDGNSGESGSAKVGATVLFVRISVPGDAIPATYTLTVTLDRS